MSNAGGFHNLPDLSIVHFTIVWPRHWGELIPREDELMGLCVCSRLATYD